MYFWTSFAPSCVGRAGWLMSVGTEMAAGKLTGGSEAFDMLSLACLKDGACFLGGKPWRVS